MKILELELHNFHGFDHRFLTFSEQFTVLVGDNGTGKTAVLDGLSIALGAFLSGLDSVQSRHIREDEVFRRTYMHGGLSNVQMQFPVIVECKGELNSGETLNWSRSKNSKKGSTTSKDAKPIMDFASALQNNVRDGGSVILPIISYYGTSRLWLQKSARTEYKIKNDRMSGYSYCLEPASNEKHFIKWMEKMTYIELQRKETPAVLQAVRSAVSSCMRDWKTIEFDVDSEELRAIEESGEILPFRLLSDGVRNMMGLVADIAHRMAQLNPVLGASVIVETPGVILIDELDLHLHPSWQRRIVNDLKRTFPKVQFIATTHSPFIIQSLEEGELRRLHFKDDDEIVRSEEFVNRSIEDITETVMEVQGVQRSDKLNEMYEAAKEYYYLLQNGNETTNQKVVDIKKRLDDIEALYSEDVAYYAFLKMERIAAGLGGDRNEGD